MFVLIEQVETEVIFHSIGILSRDFGEIITPLPVTNAQKDRPLFKLKEGSEYRLKLAFTVLHNIVSGLTYTNTVWKGGVQGLESYPHLLNDYMNLVNIE